MAHNRMRLHRLLQGQLFFTFRKKLNTVTQRFFKLCDPCNLFFLSNTAVFIPTVNQNTVHVS
jgi:hypothetical protein